MEEGFSTWRKLNPRIPVHEISQSHRRYMRKYLNLVVRLQHSTAIDAELQQQISAEKKKWRAITERIVEVVSVLAKQNLSFRGHRGEGISTLSEPEETISKKTGNFLAIIRLLAKCDAILAEHLQKGKEKPKSVTYLSNRSQNEIIDLLGQTVNKKIIPEIKDAKYFSIMLDSTPDIAHEDQVSETVRYVHIDENRKVEIKEVFLGLFPINKKDAVILVNKILEKLEEDKISIQDCRGQLMAQQEMNRVMVQIVNRLQTEIEDCSVRLQDLKGRFSFLLNLNSVIIESEQERERLKKKCSDLEKYDDSDVTASQLYDEIIDFVMLL